MDLLLVKYITYLVLTEIIRISVIQAIFHTVIFHNFFGSHIVFGCFFSNLRNEIPIKQKMEDKNYSRLKITEETSHHECYPKCVSRGAVAVIMVHVCVGDVTLDSLHL